MVGKNIKFEVDAAARNIDKAFKVENSSVVTDKLNIEEILKSLDDVEVLVGIPESTSERKKEGLTNADLAFIHTHGARTSGMIKEMNKAIDKQNATFSQAYKMYLQAHGSPAYRIPPRPIIEPAIEANIEKISKHFQKATKYFLEGNRDEGIKELHATGLLAQNYVRKWFVDERNNWPPNAPSTIKAKGSDRPLIDTGELRKSITYVVRENRSRQSKSLRNIKVRKLKLK